MRGQFARKPGGCRDRSCGLGLRDHIPSARDARGRSMNRRNLIVSAGAAALAAGSARAGERPRWMSPLLPDGTRDEAVLEALPGKQKLIRLADRPPNYETPIDAFRTSVTPNEDF